VLKALLGSGVGIVAGTGAYGVFYGRHDLVITRAMVPVAGLPASLDGLRIGLVTDIHRSFWVSHEDVAAAVGLVTAERTDLIVLGGDYVTWGDRRYVGPSSEALAPLSAPYGVFAILGNHDDDHDMAAALTRQRIEVLRDARTRITIRDEPVDLVGIRFWTRRQADIARLMRGTAPATILLAHDPRRFTEAAALSVPLVLSGHTHGGQVVLPGIGAVAAQKFPVVAGLARQGNTTMFVSRGIGTIYIPVRINCPPEVAVLTLQRA
jgi:predicted MPP superfamily phosphohydrolase